MTEEQLIIEYLTGKGLSVETASAGKLSDAKSFASCYKWYIEKMQVLHENAELAAKVWVDKYALHDKSGLCLESTPEDMWDREAAVLAEVEIKTNKKTKKTKEEWQTYFRGILDGWKYSPQGSGLFALGNPYVKASSSNCFHPDTMVTTTDGAKKISEVTIGDTVITHSGQLAPVSQIHKNLLNNRQLYEIKVHGGDKFIVTENHKFYSISKEQEGWGLGLSWNSIDYLRTGDYIALPKNNHSFNDITLDLADYIDLSPYTNKEQGRWIDLVVEESFLFSTRHWSYKHPNHLKEFTKNSKPSAKLPRFLTLSPDFMRFLGIWYGDGCVFHRTTKGYSTPIGITFTLNQNERELISFVSKIGQDTFGLIPDINHNSLDNTTQVVFHSNLLGIIFRSLFGHGFSGKKLGPKFFELPTAAIKQLMYGLIDSDGSVANTEIRVVMCNPQLITDMFHLLRANGIQVRHSKLKESPTNFGTAKNCHRLAFTPSHEILTNLLKFYADDRLQDYPQKSQVRQYTKKIEDTELAVVISKTPIDIDTPFVYTLGVDHPDHSYTVEGVICQNCFTLPPPKDNLESIIDTAKYMARIFAARGGEGHDISGLRPYHAVTNNAARTSTGAASFMDFFSYMTGLIGQHGRRGANLLTIRVSHPDIIRFVTEKSDEDKQDFFEALADAGVDINDYRWSAVADRLKSTSHSNVSVRIFDDFIDAVKNDTDYELWFEFDDNQYPRISKKVKAKEIWDTLMLNAWKSAEPGILNWDHIIRESPADQYRDLKNIPYFDVVTGENRLVDYSFETVGLNPCAEETLSAFDSCNLGIFFLPAFVKDPFTKKASFDFSAYEKHIQGGVRAQDNIKEWDIPILPLDGNRIAAVLGRRISVGNTGLADALAMLGLSYDSNAAIDMAEKIYKFMCNTAYKASANLAEEKGSFPVFEWEKHIKCPFIQRLDESTKLLIAEKGLRNIGLLTQSPAGSMSILFRNCASGIEPMFLPEYHRNVKVPGTAGDFAQHTIYHQAIQDALNIDPNFKVDSVFVAAGQIHYKQRIKMQSVIQRYIDHSISSTINLPEETTVEEISSIYMLAYESGLKGITVYRDGCRTGVLNAIKPVTKVHKAIERPKCTDIDIFKLKYKEKPYMILVGKTNGVPIEIFGGEEVGVSLPTKYAKAELCKRSRGHYALTVQLSEDPEDVMKMSNIGKLFPAQDVITITRMISLAMRNGVSIADIVDQLSKSASSLYDAPAVFARVLKNYVSDEDMIVKEMEKGKLCPECKTKLEYKRESGCLTEICPSCSFSNSKCS